MRRCNFLRKASGFISDLRVFLDQLHTLIGKLIVVFLALLELWHLVSNAAR